MSLSKVELGKWLLYTDVVGKIDELVMVKWK